MQSAGEALADLVAPSVVKRILAPVIQPTLPKPPCWPALPRDADLEALRPMVDAARLQREAEAAAIYATMTPGQRARHDERERQRHMIAAAYRRDKLKR